MNIMFQIFIILGFIIICYALGLIVKSLNIINDNLEYILKEIYILIRDKK